MALLRKSKKGDNNEIKVDQEKVELSSRKVSLNAKFLKKQIDKIPEQESDSNTNEITFIDRLSVEEKIVKVVNNLSPAEKDNLGESIRDLIREILDEEFRDKFVPQNNPVVRVPRENDFVGYRDYMSEMEEYDESDKIGAVLTVNQLIERLEADNLDKLAIACINAVNKEKAKASYGVQAAENINNTVLEKLSRIFTESKIIRIGEAEYVVYDFSTEPREFVENINTFRKAIYSINTSNQYNYPIELNIGDAHGLLCESAAATYEKAHSMCFAKDEEEHENNISSSVEISVEPVAKKEYENPIVKVEEPKTAYKSLEFIDDDFEENVSNYTDYEEPIIKSKPESKREVKNVPDVMTAVYKKGLSEFPNVKVNANIVDTETRKSVDVRLIVHFIEKSNVKQEVVVSGHVGGEEVLLISDFNDEKTTIEVAAKYGLILRFGSAVKLFILKEYKEKYQLWQEVKKNFIDKQPFKAEELYVCPLGLNGNKAAIVYTNDEGHMLIKTNEEGVASFRGKEIVCKNSGSEFIVNVK